MSMLHKFFVKGFDTQCYFRKLNYFFQVSTAEQYRSSPKSMISCNKKSLYLPQEMSAVYIEFTEYYYPDGKDFPSKRVSYSVICPLLGKLFFSFLAKLLSLINVKKETKVHCSFLWLSLYIVHNSRIAFLCIIVCSWILFPYQLVAYLMSGTMQYSCLILSLIFDSFLY